MIYLYCYTNWK